MKLSIDELVKDVVETVRAHYEAIMKLDKPIDNSYQDRMFWLLHIYERGEIVTVNGRVINQQRNIASAIARKFVDEVNLLFIDILSRNWGKSSDEVSAVDKEFLDYLKPRSMIPFGTYADAVEKARGDIVKMMNDVRQTLYQRALVSR